MSNTDLKKTTALTNVLGIYLAIALVMPGALGYLVIKPAYHNIQASRAATKKLNDQIAALHKLDSDTTILLANYESIKNRRDSILDQLPASDEEERLLVMLSDLASKSGVSLSTFSPSGSPSGTASGAYVPYPAALSISGDYVHVDQFMKSIENAARFVTINDANFSQGNKQQGMTVGMDITAYYQTTPATTSATATSTGAVKK